MATCQEVSGSNPASGFDVGAYCNVTDPDYGLFSEDSSNYFVAQNCTSSWFNPHKFIAQLEYKDLQIKCKIYFLLSFLIKYPKDCYNKLYIPTSNYNFQINKDRYFLGTS